MQTLTPGPHRATNLEMFGAEELLSHERLMRREAEHRLANFLQLVSANLTRSSRNAGTEQARRAIGVAADQIVTLGKLHQALASSGRIRSEDCKGKLQALCDSLYVLVLEPRGHALTLETLPGEPGPFPLRSDLAHSLVLIVSELVINAAKHAFPAGTPGRIRVMLQRSGNRLSCSVVDDGTFRLSRDNCFDSQGMRLTRDLAERAGGNCSWVFSPTGTEAQISLPSADMG